MAFDYSKLIGRIREKGHTLKGLSEKLGYSHTYLSINTRHGKTLTNKTMKELINELEIPEYELGSYFLKERINE